MNKLTHIFTVILTIVCVSVVTLSCKSKPEEPVEVVETPPPIDTTTIQQQAIETIFEDILDGKNLGELHRYFSQDYIEHNDLGMNIGFNKLKGALSQTTNIIVTREIYHIAAEGEYVAVHSKTLIGDIHYINADIFKFSNNKVIERWSLSQQEIQSGDKSANTARWTKVSFEVSKPMENEYKISTEDFYNKILSFGDVSSLENLLDDSFIPHSPDLPSDKQEFVDMVSIGPIKQKLIRTIGRGSIVFAHIEDVYTGTYQIHIFEYSEDLKLVEYWVVKG